MSQRSCALRMSASDSYSPLTALAPDKAVVSGVRLIFVSGTKIWA